MKEFLKFISNAYTFVSSSQSASKTIYLMFKDEHSSSNPYRVSRCPAIPSFFINSCYPTEERTIQCINDFFKFSLPKLPICSKACKAAQYHEDIKTEFTIQHTKFTLIKSVSNTSQTMKTRFLLEIGK